MNIFGRVFGGLLVLISLGWLASIVGIRPSGLASNQISSDPKTGMTNLTTPAQPGTTTNDGKASGSSSKVGASKFATGQPTTGQTTAGKPEVETNPRGVSNGTKAVGQNATTPETETAPVAVPPQKAAPVAAGW